MHSGRVVFGAMDEVVFGGPAAAAIRIAEQAMGTRWIRRNPRQIASPARWQQIRDLAA